MQTYEQSVTAGTPWTVNGAAAYLRILATDAPVSIRFWLSGSPVGDVKEVESGFALELAGGFDSVQIESDTTQTVKIACGAGRMAYDRMAGEVSTINRGAMAQSVETVTSSAAELVAANASRRFLLIQNNHATANVFVDLSGTAATLAGLKIAAGGSLLLDQFVTAAAVSAIGDTASNTAVVVVEG